MKYFRYQTLALCICIISFTFFIVRAQDIPAKNMKDLQQDNHIAYTDQRVGNLEGKIAANEIRREATIAKRDAEILELHDRVNNIYSWGAAAFATLTILQILGLIKQFGKEHAELKRDNGPNSRLDI